MERNVEIDKISDGKRYGANDLVKVGCDDCRGCSACCHGMGDSIILDPMDVYRLEKKLGKTMEEILLAGSVALRVVDGVILPHLKMTELSDQCSFLNEEGRCSIHDARPGFCRMFPLGRLYEDGTFSYFLQVNECPKENKTKVKVRRWLDTPEQESFLTKRYNKGSCPESFFNLQENSTKFPVDLKNRRGCRTKKTFYKIHFL